MHRVLIIIFASGLMLGGVPALRAQTVSRLAHQGKHSSIQGNALDATNAPLANTAVRARDARFGAIVDRQTTDRAGFFAFDAIEPGDYVVEIVGPDKAVLAASQIIEVSADETASAVVKLPFKLSPVSNLVSHTIQSALAVTAAAASSAVLSAVVTTDASGERIRH